jgi:hypothetical protein
LCTYAFTIAPIPHVFGDYCFAGHKHKYMEKYTKRRILTRRNPELHTGIKERPINSDYLGAKPPKEQPGSSEESTM